MTDTRLTPLCYTVEDLCGLLQISRPVAYQLVHTEGFPSVRIGKRITIPKTELERWLAKASGDIGGIPNHAAL